MLELLAQKWWAVALRGVLAIVFGILALAFPGSTLVSLALLFGAYVFVSGVFSIVAAFGSRRRDAVWYVLDGILGIAVGVATFFYPGITAQALVFLIGLWAILTGIFEVIAGFELPLKRDWLLTIAGGVSIIFGVLVFAYPASGALAVVWMIGIYALVHGVTMLAFGIRLRNLRGELAALLTT
ncbi:MAG: HdeD family acid-resistance protein [Anaerolineae bacterium]|nr:HdeD family acid-resistance protein [Anaerolineae bacterium]